MDNLKKENNSAFEEGLKEILSCKESNTTQKRTSPASLPEKEMIFSKKSDDYKKKLTNFFYLRIIAALIALGLIFLFGLQIAYK